MGRDGIQARNRAADRFYRLSEGADSREIRECLRRMGDALMELSADALGPEQLTDVSRLADSAAGFAEDRVPEAVLNHEKRLRLLISRPARSGEPDQPKGEKKMGLFRKVFGERKDALTKTTDAEIRQVSGNVEQAQREMDDACFAYDNELSRYRQLLKEVTGADRQSAQYKAAMSRLMLSKKTQASLNDRINSAFRILDQNQDYLIRLGKLDVLKKYAGMLPDAAKAQTVLDSIAERALDYESRQKDLEEVLQGDCQTGPAADLEVDPEILADLEALRQAEEAEKNAKAAAAEKEKQEKLKAEEVAEQRKTQAAEPETLPVPEDLQAEIEADLASIS